LKPMPEIGRRCVAREIEKGAAIVRCKRWAGSSRAPGRFPGMAGQKPRLRVSPRCSAPRPPSRLKQQHPRRKPAWPNLTEKPRRKCRRTPPSRMCPSRLWPVFLRKSSLSKRRLRLKA
jgi:hypothetical protein